MWDYDDEGRMVASSRLIPLDMTNVTWLTTCYEYDDLGRQIATWQTNRSAKVGLPVTRTRYDALGRVVACVDQLGNTTTTTYSNDGRTVSVKNPNTSTRITTRSVDGDTLSITECKTKQESLSISADLSNGKFGQLLNSVLGVSFSIDYTHTDTITTCGKCCGSGICGFTTTTESEEQFSGSIGKDAWNVVEVAISYSVSGSYSSTYDSCTSTRTNTGCGITSISVSAGPCIKIGGDLAKFCIKGSAGINHKQCADGTNEWSGYGNIYFENCLGWFCGSGVIWSW